MASEPRVEELLATIRRAIDQDINELDRRAQESGQRPAVSTSLQGLQRLQPRQKIAPPEAEPAAPLRGTLNEFHDKYQDVGDGDISRLRSRVRAGHPDEVPPAVTTERPAKITPERTSVFSRILKAPPRQDPPLRTPPPAEPPVAEEYAPQVYDPYEVYDPNQQWQGEPQPDPQAYYPPVVPDPYQQPYQDPQAGLMSPDPAFAAHASFQALAQLALAQIGGDAGLQQMTRDVLNTLLREWLDRNLPPLVEALVREEIERVARGGR